MSSLFHREEGQEVEEGPVDRPRPARERERSHSKTKKTRRERRHADQGVETMASVPPSKAVLQTQVKSVVGNNWSLRNSMM